MLSSIIQNISEHSDRYGTFLWKFHISGDMLEIYVKPTYRNKPDQFRQAVICIGQVIQAVKDKVTSKGLRIQIQSFPSLHEKHLVAIVRIRKAKINNATKENNLILNLHQPVIPLLNDISSQYGMILKPMPTIPPENAELEKYLSLCSDKHSGRQTLVLCSKTNNPFVWLETGYWKEQVLQLKEEHPPISNVEINSLPDQWCRFYLNQYFEGKIFSQKLVYL